MEGQDFRDAQQANLSPFFICPRGRSTFPTQTRGFSKVGANPLEAQCSHAAICFLGAKSAQRFEPGNILCGLQRFSGSNTRRNERMASRSSFVNCFSMKSIFSTPMPCSPVT